MEEDIEERFEYSRSRGANKSPYFEYSIRKGSQLRFILTVKVKEDEK